MSAGQYMNAGRGIGLRRAGIVLALLATWSGGSRGQTVAPAPTSSSAATSSSSSSSSAMAADPLGQAVRELGDQVRELRASMAEMRADSVRSQAETRELRRELDELRAASSDRRPVVTEAVVRSEGKSASTSTATMSGGLRELLGVIEHGGVEHGSVQHDSVAGSQDQSSQEQGVSTGSSSSTPAVTSVVTPDDQKKTGRPATLEEEYELLSGKVDDQYQTKVESASKYRMRISGIVLTNVFSNQGEVDNIDIPELAYGRQPGDSGGSFGATLRQSQVGFEVFGPRVAGARTRADLSVDLAGGFPEQPNGIESGLMRLRTATMRMDWDNTSVVVGQDGIFFSPNSPTSFASLAQPALSYAGNLWSWVPQVRVEHRFAVTDSSSWLVQGGILDPVSGEVPGTGTYRSAGPGEASRQPAYGSRIAWTHDISGQPLRLGAGGYYSRQDYGFDRNVNAWAAMADVQVPLGSQFELSGKFYRGRALGGLYGGLGQSVLFSGPDIGEAYTKLIGLNTVGGWAQLKYRPAPKVEFNAAFGMDNPFAKDLEYFPYPYSYLDAGLARNHAGFVNFIYRPRSNLLFSAEYRRIVTDSLANGNWNAGHLNLSMGVLF
ncbi:MAG: hypothetical protein WA618_09140 [Terriglobales bacterium]